MAQECPVQFFFFFFNGAAPGCTYIYENWEEHGTAQNLRKKFLGAIPLTKQEVCRFEFSLKVDPILGLLYRSTNSSEILSEQLQTR